MLHSATFSFLKVLICSWAGENLLLMTGPCGFIVYKLFSRYRYSLSHRRQLRQWSLAIQLNLFSRNGVQSLLLLHCSQFYKSYWSFVRKQNMRGLILPRAGWCVDTISAPCFTFRLCFAQPSNERQLSVFHRKRRSVRADLDLRFLVPPFNTCFSPHVSRKHSLGEVSLF